MVSREDSIMVTLVDQIRRGFPDSGYDVNPAIREFHKYRHGLCVIDGVPCYKTRASCRECHRIAPSQPAAPPVSPPSPEYPFQLQVCDYFSLHGRNYLALADRYSGWLTAYRVGS